MKKMIKNLTLIAILSMFLMVLFSCSKKGKNKTVDAGNKNNDAYELFSSGADLLEAREYEKSIEVTKKAAALFKKFDKYENGKKFYTDCLVQIGEAYLRNGDIDNAKKQFMDALEFASADNDVSAGIAAVFFRLDRYSEGNNFFQMAIEKYIHDPVVVAPLCYYNAGCAFAIQDYAGARYLLHQSSNFYIKAHMRAPSGINDLLKKIDKAEGIEE